MTRILLATALMVLSAADVRSASASCTAITGENITGADLSRAAIPLQDFFDTFTELAPIRDSDLVASAIAHTLGLGVADLLAITQTAIDVAFTTAERRAQLHAAVVAWSAANSRP